MTQFNSYVLLSCIFMWLSWRIEKPHSHDFIASSYKLSNLIIKVMGMYSSHGTPQCDRKWFALLHNNYWCLMDKYNLISIECIKIWKQSNDSFLFSILVMTIPHEHSFHYTILYGFLLCKCQHRNPLYIASIMLSTSVHKTFKCFLSG